MSNLIEDGSGKKVGLALELIAKEGCWYQENHIVFHCIML